METAEIIVYLAIAVAVGGLIIAFIGHWDAKATYEGLQRIFTGAPPQAYEEITAQEFPNAVLSVWDACGLGTTALNKTVYVKDAVPFNKSMLFARIRESSLCKTLQSAQEGCGAREDVVMENMTGPAIVLLSCDPTSERLIVTA